MANITSSDAEIAVKLNKQLTIVGLFNPNRSMEKNVWDLSEKANRKKEIHDNALRTYGKLSET